jgi:glucose/arabinose dehydrogenase
VGVGVGVRTFALVCALPLALAALPLEADDGARLVVPAGFSLEIIAHVAGARELAATPGGGLVVGTLRNEIVLVRDAEGKPAAPQTFARIDEAPDAGVALSGSSLYVGTHGGVWRIPMGGGDDATAGKPVKLEAVRTSSGGGHRTTTVAVLGSRVYAGVGSSCNACTETDPTRASVQEFGLDGGAMQAKAVHIRNPIALAVDSHGELWAGVAGQDELEHGHPYEIFDAVTRHPGVADYGWPACYENHRSAASAGSAGSAGGDCAHQTVPRVVFPAYETPIGATFYPVHESGHYAFPAAYAGGAFVTLHGSWHQPPVPPRVVFVPMRDGEPVTPVDWSDPSKQWREFVGGFQQDDGSRIGRPTGIAVGSEGSLFVADDAAGVIYRIRPVHG